ncbi:MAG: hypothetical protein Q4G63_02295 [Bacteroidia bacterium]|nr:hypothetical protein [Bacteroidia bacterium]
MLTEKFQNKYRIPPARAAWHDYSGGVYYITICVAEREYYFGKITNGEMQLTEIGKYADKCVMEIQNLHSDIIVPMYVVMPNHIHLIVIVETPVIDTPNVETSHRGVFTRTPNNDVKLETPYYDVKLETPYYDVSTGTEQIQQTPIRKNEKMQSIADQCGRLSHVISRFKSAVTRYANQNGISFKWQTRFHDRIVRDQNELNRIAEYIENNPYNWLTDEYY